MGHRMSSLPIAQFCGASAALANEHGAGRAAAMSSAFHALLAGDAATPQERGRLARLTEEERAEVMSWKKPEPVEIDGTYLFASEARHEVELCLSKDGYPCEPKDALTVGHADLVWFEEDVGSINATHVWVGDFKRSTFTTTDGPESLQLLAYGLAAALEHDADYFRCGIWPLTDGDGWEWGPLYETRSFEAAALWERIREAASASPTEYATGAHCRQCYGRPYCREYLTPVSDPASALEPLSRPGGLTAETAPRALELYERANALLKMVKDNLEAYAERTGGIPGPDGKVWRKLMTKGGGTQVDTARLLKENPGLAEKYTVIKPPHSMGFRWLKP